MTRSLQILVVDDEIGFARMLGRALRRLGHVPTVVTHPEDAVSVFGTRSFDAVITDIDMPVMTGIELAQKLRSARADVPIAFCTGSDPGEPHVSEATAYGAVWPKVWREHDVLAMLAKMSK